jgi:protein-glutamine gamma-glutamyltransferase
MRTRGARRLQLALRDLAAGAAFVAMGLSGQVPLWTAVLFAGALGLAFFDIRPFARHVRESALLLLGSVIILWAAVASGRMDLVVAACACAALLTGQRMLSAPGAAVDQQVALSGLLMVSGGAALSADLFFLPCLVVYTVCTTLALTLGEVERAATPIAPPMVSPAIRAALVVATLAVLGGGAFFVLFPRLSWNLAARRGSLSFGGAVVGLGDRVRLGGSGELKSNPRIVLRAHLDPDPGLESLGAYWVAYRFDSFDGVEWRGHARAGRATPRVVVGPGPKKLVAQRIEILPAYGSHAAVALDRPVQFADAAAHLPAYSVRTPLVPLGDESVRLEGGSSGFSYHAYSALDASPVEPDPAARQRRLTLPPGLDPRVEVLARELAGDATDPALIAHRLELGLQQRYRYTLELPGPVADPLADFLFHLRAGHCEDFATALAIMLRTLGIPSRVVTGFYGGEREAGEYLVRAGDAHAWVEADVPGGVLRVDATPAQSRSATRTTLLSWVLRAYEGLEVRWLNGVVDYSLSDQVAFLQGVGGLQRPLQVAGRFGRGLALPLGAAAALAVLFLWLGRRRIDEATQLGRALQRLLVSAGLLTSDHWLEHLPRRAGTVPAAVHRAVGRYLEARFGTKRLAPGERRALLEAARAALGRPAPKLTPRG